MSHFHRILITFIIAKWRRAPGRNPRLQKKEKKEEVEEEGKTDQCDKMCTFDNWTADRQLLKRQFVFSFVFLIFKCPPTLQACAGRAEENARMYTRTVFYATGKRLIPTSCLNA